MPRSKLWAEVWRRPGHASFGRVIDDPPFTVFGLHDGLNQIGDGNFAVSDSFGRLDEILKIDRTTPANSVTSLIRIWSELDLTKPVFEWLPNALIPSEGKDDPTVEGTGLGMKAILGHARVEAFDWDGSDDFSPQDPDWLYGGTNLLRNPSFEDAPFAISNLGFEDGTRDPWWPGAVEGESANAIAQQVVVDTGVWALRVQPLKAEGGASTTFRVIPANFYTVTARVRGAVGVTYQIGASGPGGVIPVVGNSVKVDHSGGFTPGGWEVQKTFVGTGAFQTVVLIFSSAGDQTSTQLSIREGEAVLNGAFFYVDDVTVSGFGVGLNPWEPTGWNAPEVPGPVSVFEASNTFASDGTWSAKITAEDMHGMLQRINGIKRGVTYTFAVDVGHIDVAGEVALLVTDVNGNVLGTEFVTVPTAAFTRLTVTFSVPDFVAGAQGTALLQILNISGGTRTWYVDNAEFYQGQPPDTVGKILGDLYDDAVTDHVAVRVVWEDEANPGTAYLLKDFSDTVDSAGAAWADPAISIRLTMRMSYSQVMAQFAGLGYEYRIVPNDVETGIWDWQVYNPGTMSTDYTAAASPAIQGGSVDIRRSVRRFVPSGTDIMVEGLDRVTSRDRDANLVSALGRIEASRLDRELPDLPAVIAAAAEDNDRALENSGSFAYVLSGDLQDEPLTDFVIGDLLTVEDPPEVSTSARFVDVVATVTSNTVEWETQWGSAIITNPDAAVANAVAGLLARFQYPEVRPEVDTDEAEVAGGAGAAPTVVVAASDSNAFSLSRADFFCSGSADDLVIQAAIDALSTTGGRVLLCEGFYDCTSSLVLGCEVTLQGLNRDGTVVGFTFTGSTADGITAIKDGGEVRDLSVRAETSAGSASGIVGVRIGADNTMDNVKVLLSDGIGILVVSNVSCGSS